jgi:hypothetical protein
MNWLSGSITFLYSNDGRAYMTVETPPEDRPIYAKLERIARHRLFWTLWIPTILIVYFLILESIFWREANVAVILFGLPSFPFFWLTSVAPGLTTWLMVGNVIVFIAYFIYSLLLSRLSRRTLFVLAALFLLLILLSTISCTRWTLHPPSLML